MKTREFIIDRGRGPEIEGTRITVYSILDFVIEGWHCERIADFFRIHPEEVQAATEYIREHTLEVLRDYVKILERCERGNPLEIRAKTEESRQKFLELVQEVREAKARGETDVRELIQSFRETKMQGNGNADNHGGQ